MKKSPKVSADEVQQADPDFTTEDRPMTVMAIQEILGLFAEKADLGDDQDRHEYLKKKPLGLI